MAIRSLRLSPWHELRTLTEADAFVIVGLCVVVATMMVPLLRKTAPGNQCPTDIDVMELRLQPAC